ncbi:hypothetical protein NNJEOMEG_02434 [Fundidesulfovibrio magnetotacticus]|uniref:Uncharacterized protein n=2 Tax=Fundidesulfovibrio magnetotacticus TaxID=2730080 RepID=A0A6V8LY61_9BACT|nr:hypothetical protein NNJEOMEG_02434 [Fundidesulfovibrio magnetotacticus]
MGYRKPSVLSARIINCLQTILELEPMLRSIDSGQLLLSEFKTLKAFLKEMDAIALDEDDVERIETATERFLQELRIPVARSRDDAPKNMTLQ